MVGCGEEEGPAFALPPPPTNTETGDELDIIENTTGGDEAGLETSEDAVETSEETGDILETGEETGDATDDAETGDAETGEVGEETGISDVVETGDETSEESGEPDVVDPPEDSNSPPPDVDLCDVLPEPCLTEGVCISGVKSSCKDGEWTCSYQFVADYEVEETVCDGKDNDCDGAIDEGLIDLAASTCPLVGACSSGVFTFCHLGTWHCDYAAVLDYEPVESSCDSIDNDCDGETDELTNLGADACKAQGVCEGSVQAQCIGGEILCEYADAGAAYEEVETLCDGLDNDCDGYVDNLTIVGVTEEHCVTGNAPAGPCCDTQGVCAGTVTANCVGTTWQCEYAGVPDHEPLTETLCDGSDNDCDGEIDENLDAATSGCSLEGVCSEVAPTCIEGAWDCHLDGLTGYEADVETQCDNVDNDCDGVIDEELFALSSAETTECPDQGVCSAGIGTYCVGGVWECDFSTVPDHEPEEQACDNLDNDCDGETDEEIDTPSGSTEGCEQFGVGVCSNFAEFVCEGGVITCNFEAIPTYEETESSCDGLDNNCNGLTDENMVDVPDLSVTTCPSLGVCGENVEASCVDGAWECSFGDVNDFEEGEETLCDNKDNDCDGLVDEGLTDPSESDCKGDGVCATDVQVACSQGEWLCDYSAISAYSGEFEYLCDGVDNNCDGSVDEASCDLLEPCLEDDQCLTGGCRTTPDDSASYCAPGAECVIEDENGDITTVPPATSACAGDSASSSCVIGNWTTPVPCDENAPVCTNASCVICVPSSLDCEDAQTRIVCDTEGSGYSPTAGCAGGKACVGGGLCVPPSDVNANGPPIETNRTAPFITAFLEGDFVIGWTQSPPIDPGDILARRFNDVGNPVGSEVTLNEITTGAQRNASAIAFEGGSKILLVWQTILPTALDGLHARRFVSNTLTPIGDTLDIGTFDTKSHEHARVASLPNGGAVITWELVSANGKADIYGHLLDFFGNKVGGPFKVNASSLSSDNHRPDAAALPDGRFVVVWESGIPGQTSIAMQRFKANGDKQGGKITVSDGNSGPSTLPRVKPFPDATLAIVWEQAASAASPRNVRMRGFNSAGFAQGPSKVVHPDPDGDQHDPAVAIAGSNAVIVAWTDDNPGTTDGADIRARAFAPNGDPLSDVIAVNTLTSGDQSTPDIFAFKDGRVIATWRTGITEDTADTGYRIFDFSY
jgi:hypothetical protein